MEERKYIYLINYPEEESALCSLELKALFSEEINLKNKLFISNIYYNLSVSPFLKEGIDVLFEEDSLEGIINKLISSPIKAKDYKVIYLKTYDKTIPYNEKLDSVKCIGELIDGRFNIHNPKEVFAITFVDNRWYFGRYLKNDFDWHIHERKPNNYSNSINIRTARALINIAIKDNRSLTLVDPCCGVGTVIIEALSLGIDVHGYDINKSIVSKARRNLEFFGYEKQIIEYCDINNLEKKYDVAIIDLPYNLFTPITREEQISIITSSYKICNRLILLTFEDMESDVLKAGFNIVDKCTIPKGKFIRRLLVCEKERRTLNESYK